MKEGLEDSNTQTDKRHQGQIRLMDIDGDEKLTINEVIIN